MRAPWPRSVRRTNGGGLVRRPLEAHSGGVRRGAKLPWRVCVHALRACSGKGIAPGREGLGCTQPTAVVYTEPLLPQRTARRRVGGWSERRGKGRGRACPVPDTPNPWDWYLIGAGSM